MYTTARERERERDNTHTHAQKETQIERYKNNCLVPSKIKIICEYTPYKKCLLGIASLHFWILMDLIWVN